MARKQRKANDEAAKGVAVRSYVRVDSDDQRTLEELAESMGTTPAAVRTMAFKTGLEVLKDNPAGGRPSQSGANPELAKISSQLNRIENGLAKSTSASTGSLAVMSWVLPHICGMGAPESDFLSELRRKRPVDLFRASETAGGRIAKGEPFPTALSKIPDEIGFDTRRGLGISREQWKAACSEAAEQERSRNGKKRPR